MDFGGLMTIEKEFFETFGIKPNYWYYTEIGSDRYNLSRINRFLIDKTELIKLLTDNIYRQENSIVAIKVLKAEKTYPPVTPEIVLGLITILVKKHCNLTLYWGLPKLIEQILKQCIKDSKDKEIQEEVRGLFINNKQNGVTK